MRRSLFLILAVFFLFACAKREIPTGPPPQAETGVKAPSGAGVRPVGPEPESKGSSAALGEVPSFAEEALEPRSEAWVEEHRAELMIYGRSTRPLKAIFFDFDSYAIRPDMKPRLREAARFLFAHPEVRLELQGNCDERGSSEYNLALGEKRALAVKRYLVNLGVSPERLETVSFGEERPLDPGHNEKAWALNRRVDLVIIKK